VAAMRLTVNPIDLWLRVSMLCVLV
jgi:hypothetical protein